MSVSLRQLNRAALTRQLLLEPAALDIASAIDAIGPLQAQSPRSPFLVLHARVADFARSDLDTACAGGAVLKTSLLRGTLHLVTAQSYPAYAAAAMDARETSWRRLGRGIELTQLWSDLLDFTDDEARSAAQIAEFTESWLAERGGHAAAGAQTANWHLVRSNSWLVQTPDAARWGHHGTGLYRSARVVMPRIQIPEDAATVVARRYLAAFGPARAADFAFWIGESSVRRASAALCALDEELVHLTGEDGQQYLDLAAAPRPAGDIAAPVVFLPRWDGLLLGYAPDGRARVIDDALRPAVYRMVNGVVCATFLVDGMVAGRWDVQERGGAATLTLHPLVRLTARVRHRVADLAEQVLAFVVPEATSRRVREAGT